MQFEATTEEYPLNFSFLKVAWQNRRGRKRNNYKFLDWRVTDFDYALKENPYIQLEEQDWPKI